MTTTRDASHWSSIVQGRRLCLLVIANLVLTAAAHASQQDERSVGRTVEAFSLKDFRGRTVSLEDLSDQRIVVVCFMGTQCPLAKLYGPRLEALSDALCERGVAFVGVNSNVQDSLAEMAAYARKHEISFPVLKDAGNKVADQFGATRTPEVFVLDETRVIRYQGRIDGTYTFGAGVGLAKPKEARADLEIAIKELLAGKPVSVPVTETKGCLIGRVSKKSDRPTVTYSNQVARVLQKNCVKCHREGQIAPFAMNSYEDVAGWGWMIAEVVRDQRMPPWHAGELSTAKFVNDARLSEEEKELIYRWVDEGCPEGDPAELPEPRTFHEGWFMEGGPDQIIYMSEQPVPIKAAGVEDYRYYEVPGFDDDRWVKIAECMPGNHSVVHHIIVYARPPSGKPIPPGSTDVDVRDFSFVAGFAPGTRPLVAPEGWARLIPAGYSLVFEMHYTPIGTPQTDRSALGIVLMDQEDVKRVVHTGLVLNDKFRIPPFASNHRVDAQRTFKRDMVMLSLFPHMHIRGKSFRYELVSPDGNREILLDVPQYDFNWQNSYIFSDPLKIPKDSTLHVTAHFDNSEVNLANPDPSQEIKWGPQSWDEMMIGFYDTGISIEEARRRLKRKAESGGG